MATQELRRIAKEIIKIKSRRDKRLWKGKLYLWVKIYQHLLKEKTIGVGTKKEVVVYPWELKTGDKTFNI